MKTIRIFLAALLLALPLAGHAQKSLIDKYGNMEDVTTTYISRAMIEINPAIFTRDVSIGKVSGQLNAVQIISTLNTKIMKDMRKDIHTLVQSAKYELLMKQKTLVRSSEFYVWRKEDKVKELIMISEGPAALKFVYLEGEMTLKDIQNIMVLQGNN